MKARQSLTMAAAVAVALLASLAVPLIGSWAPLVSGLLLLLLVVAYLLGPKTAERLAVLLGAAGGVAGVASAMQALIEVGGQSPYSSRVTFGLAALALAALAALTSTLVSARRGITSAALFALSTVGFVSINLFYINTFYFVSTLLFWAGALVALAAGSGSSRA